MFSLFFLDTAIFKKIYFSTIDFHFVVLVRACVTNSANLRVLFQYTLAGRGEIMFLRLSESWQREDHVPACAFLQACQRLLVMLDLTQFTNKTVKTFSGGTKRKLSTAIALLGDPDLVLLVSRTMVYSGGPLHDHSQQTSLKPCADKLA